MADLLRITSVVNPKNYTLQSKPLAQSDAVFDLVDLSKIVKTNDKTQEFRQNDNSFTGNNSDALLDIQLKIAKNPSYTVRLMKDLLGENVVSQFVQSGSPDVINEFNEFSKNIFLSSGNIVSDLISQQKGTTAFSGELFSLLREIAELTSSKELKNAIAVFLKNAFSLSSQNDILKSLSSSFKFLSESMAPSRSLSASLEEMANKLSSMNAGNDFQKLKSEALKLLDSVLNSLIATDKIKNMVSLIKYNLSRFNDNPNTVDNGFKSILSLVNNQNLKELLSDGYDKFIQGSSIPTISKNALLSNSESFLAGENLAYNLAKMAGENVKQINTLSFHNDLDVISQRLSGLVDSDGNISGMPLEEGSKAIADLLKTILPKNSGGEVARFISDFNQSKDLNVLINRLSFILNNIDNVDVKTSLASVMNKVLTSLSTSPDIIFQPPTSMENLVNFLTKAINNQNISHLGIIDPNTIVQSMLTAPGVFTPLLHYILPVQIEDLRAFGELWIDNESNSAGSDADENSQHIFLSFDIERVGLFELEIFSKGSSLNVSLFCPKNLVSFFSVLKGKIADVADSCGYSIKKTTVAPLSKVRTLVDIFPRIAERRAGLNVKI